MKRISAHYYLLLLISSILLDSCHSSKKVTTTSVSETHKSTYTSIQNNSPSNRTPSKSKSNNPPTKNEIAPTESSIVAKYASKLDVSKRDITNDRLYTFIDGWYGTPYKYAGRTKSGIDCSDFAALLFQSVYNITLSGSVVDICKRCKPIKTSELREGDLLFFKINSKSLSHVGIYLQNHKFVHASVHAGVIIDDLEEDYYKKYFYKAGRILK